MKGRMAPKADSGMEGREEDGCAIESCLVASLLRRNSYGCSVVRTGQH